MGGSNIITGTLDLLILQTLPQGARHGYGISLHLRTVSKGVFEIGEGVLYPALHRLEREGLIAARWGKTDTGRRAKFYRLTTAGRTRLDAEIQRWNRYADAVQDILLHPAAE